MSKRTRKPSGKKQKYKAPVLYINHNARREKNNSRVFFSLILVGGSPRVPALSPSPSRLFTFWARAGTLWVFLCVLVLCLGSREKSPNCSSVSVHYFRRLVGRAAKRGAQKLVLTAAARLFYLASFSLSFQPPFRAFLFLSFYS